MPTTPHAADSSNHLRRPPRVVIVGDESLALTCAEIARAAGLEVVVLVSSSDAVLQAATSIDMPTVDLRATGGFVEALEPYAFDVLISAANQRIIPEGALAMADTRINFHDGPLPGYAGLNVTSWAIHNGETEHGVTWHVMTDAVDRGAVIASSRFDILPDETALSLNARCYEAAVALFPAIAEAIAAGTLESTPQQDGTTQMYRRRDRPQVFIDPGQSADLIARRCRSLDVGPRVDNFIGSARLVLDDRYLLAHDVASIDEPAGSVGRTVLGPDGSLRITCAGGVLSIARLTSPEGESIEAAEVVDMIRASHDGILPSPPADLVGELGSNDGALAIREPWWAARLHDVDISVPVFLAEARTDESSDLSVTVSEQVSDSTIAAAVVTWLGAIDEATPVIEVTDSDVRAQLAALQPVVRPPVLLQDVELERSSAVVTELVRAELSECYGHGPFLSDLVDRNPSLRTRSTVPFVRIDFGVAADEPSSTSDALLRFERTTDGALILHHHLDVETAHRVAEQLVGVIESFVRGSDSVVDVALLGATDRALLDELNGTAVDFDRAATIDSLFTDATRAHRDAPAVSAGDRTLSYEQLGHAVDNLCDRLRQAGIERGDVVAISLNRDIEMVVSLFAVMQCGAAYLPLDPSYPTDRLHFMVEDSDVKVVLATPDTAGWLRDGLTVVEPSIDFTPVAERMTPPPHQASDLAYVIYTSGSTGLPKGVQLEHGNVVNFFVAMDEIIDHRTPGVWLAVTSLSFDISVLELMWTLTRGYHVVVKRESGFGSAALSASSSPAPISRSTSMSLFYFAAGEEQAHEGYRLMLESAKWADDRGFEAVWVPERHFHDFGAPYPNPSVVAAALAATTKNIAIRAGSVVLPLHSPIRVAEEWAVVDNLSGGRVGISFAAGWQPNDFVLNPTAYATAKESLPQLMTTVQELWRGESVELPGHDGRPVSVTTLPRPVQAELPSWLTSAGSASTFERAGRLGLNVLTHLLGQSIEQLTSNIDGYRKAWAEAGHDGDGQVTLMLHTFLAEDADAARETARLPLKGYLGTAVGLLKDMASAFPTFANSGASADEAFKSLSEDEIDQLLDMAADRYLLTSGLFGDTDDALDMIRRASAAGADEIACLIDFGIETDAVLDSLVQLEAVHARVREEQQSVTGTPGSERDETVAGLVERHGVTHLQCTPSLAAMLIADPTDRESLRELRHIMLGGEALPAALAADIRALDPGRFTNMYGPTETTIWSLTHEVDQSPSGSVPIGTPVANNTVYVLDGHGRQLPVGVFGELHIGGEGVARGYHDRPELNAERFVERPGLGRLYGTGDVVRVHQSGYIEFGGRADGQVKIRGNRVELGEIESVLDRHPAVSQSVVVARGDTDPMLVAFVTTTDGQSPSTSELRTHVADVLPAPMVPSVVVILDALPLTPNGKIDRKRLPSNIDTPIDASSLDPQSAPSNDNEKLVADVWLEELGRPAGRDENFFDIGGHSLLAVKVFRSLADSTGFALALTDVFRYPTIKSFAQYLGELETGGADAAKDRVLSSAVAGTDRAARRRKRTPR